jgi:hypothetical protein
MGIVIGITIGIEGFVTVSTITTAHTVITVEDIAANSSSDIIKPCFAINHIGLDFEQITTIKACSMGNLGLAYFRIIAVAEDH